MSKSRSEFNPYKTQVLKNIKIDDYELEGSLLKVNVTCKLYTQRNACIGVLVTIPNSNNEKHMYKTMSIPKTSYNFSNIHTVTKTFIFPIPRLLNEHETINIEAYASYID